MAVISRNPQLRFIAIFIAVIILAILLYNTGALRPVESLVFLILNPIQKTFYSWGVNVFVSDSLLEIDQLRVEIEDSEEKVARLTIENAKLLTAASNSEIVEQELNYLKEKQQNGVLAHITSRSAEGKQNVVTINKGASDGINEGYATISGQGIIVGKILTVRANSAQVLLLTDNNCRLATNVLNNNHSPGVVVGKHGLALEMELIPQNEEISEGQIIVTSGQEESIPSDLVVGTIESVQSEQEELFQSATVTQLVSYERLTVVMVIIPTSND